MVLKKSAMAPLSIRSFTSSEAGAWSNSYLISGESETILFDVFMLRSDAERIADGIASSGKTLKSIIISHAHPDHFMGLEVIVDRFPGAQVLSTSSVVEDIQQDGPWMISLLQSKLGAAGPTRLVVPQALSEPSLSIDGSRLEIVEFGEAESKHTAALYIPAQNAFLSADLVYNQAHLYLQERHLESWLTRLEELDAFAKNRVSTIYPGHGSAAGLELISQTREYLHDFAEAIEIGDSKAAEKRLLDKYPNYHVRQFLSVFSLPSYFATSPA